MPGPESQQGKTFICKACGRDFVFHRKHAMTTRCCSACWLAKRHFKRMKKVWEYMGGMRCSQCGYDKSSRALEFHHVDPNSKSFNIGGIGPITRYRWETIRDELDKCIVLCRNCHAETHEYEAQKNPGPWQIWRVFHEGESRVSPLGDDILVVRDFIASTLSRNDFCREHGIPTRDLANWIRQFWTYHATAYLQGTLVSNDYCTKHNLDLLQFHRWRRRVLIPQTS